MLRRSALLSLAALVLLSACSRSEHKPPAPGSRTPAAIWGDVLGQRNNIHLGFVKELEEVTHKDCADVGASAHRLDDLLSELMNTLGATISDRGQLRSIGDAASRLNSVVSQIRESALAESPGAWPELRFPLDFALYQMEQIVSPGVLGPDSVTSCPGFETKPLPRPPSPV
ncbi:MAG TPA: hypothetical protein VMR50_16770 [Myxococcota bacterium]|nr:hypothetical protein [Myxococcota bacterium]